MTATISPRLDPAGLADLLTSGADMRLLDVRTPAEFESAHIPGSYNVPLGALVDHAEQLSQHLEVPVVLVCRSGRRASQARDTLAGTGMTDLQVLEGGMAAWDDGRRSVRRGQPRWDLERQVRLVAGSVVLAGIVGSVFSPRLKYLSGAAGAGLTFAALSNTCMMGTVLAKLPYNRNITGDIEAVVAQITGTGEDRER